MTVNVDVTYTKEALLRTIHRKAGMSGGGSLHKVMEDIIEKLRGSERLIIVDEADLLSLHGLEALRAIHSETRIGVLLCGMPRLVEVLRGCRGQYEQIYSRCETHLRLDDQIDTDDAEEIIKAYLPEAESLAKTFVDAAHGNTRMLANIARRCLRITQKQRTKISKDMVLAVAETMIV